jgi:hypothetical protein
LRTQPTHSALSYTRTGWVQAVRRETKHGLLRKLAPSIVLLLLLLLVVAGSAVAGCCQAAGGCCCCFRG